jgi:hypothetical protein
MRGKDVALELLAAAGRTFGRDVGARLRWLLNFAERDIRSPGAADRASMEIFAFTFAARLAGPVAQAGAGMGMLDPETLSTRAIREARLKAREAQQAARDVLRSLATGVRCRLVFEVVGWERLPDRRLLPVVGGDWRSRFLGAVAMLLVEAGPDLAVCAREGCERLFLRSRRQAYCTARCSQRQRTQRFRAAHPQEVRETRHQSYARRRRREPGKQNVKVGRLARRDDARA